MGYIPQQTGNGSTRYAEKPLPQHATDSGNPPRLHGAPSWIAWRIGELLTAATMLIAVLSFLYAQGWLTAPARQTDVAELTRRLEDLRIDVGGVRNDVASIRGAQDVHTAAIARIEGKLDVIGRQNDHAARNMPGRNSRGDGLRHP